MAPNPIHPRHRPGLRAAVDRYQAPLIGFARRWTGNLASAQDIAQETLTRLCQQPAARLDELLGGDRAALEGWLFVVARNLAIDASRAASHGPAHGSTAAPPADPAPGPAERAADAELADRIIGLIADLPTRQAEVVQLRFEQGLSYRAISAITGHTVSYVGYLLHEGLKNLRIRAAAIKPTPAPPPPPPPTPAPAGT